MVKKSVSENQAALEKSADELWEKLTKGEAVIDDPADGDYWFKEPGPGVEKSKVQPND